MQIVVLVVIILIVFMVLDYSFAPLIMLALWAVTIFSLMCAVFFVIATIICLFARKKDAQFERLERHEKFGSHAVYTVEGEEYDNSFPADSFMEKLFYKKKDVSVRILKIKNHDVCIDGISQVVIAIGLPVFIGMSFLFIWLTQNIVIY